MGMIKRTKKYLNNTVNSVKEDITSMTQANKVSKTEPISIATARKHCITAATISFLVILYSVFIKDYSSLWIFITIFLISFGLAVSLTYKLSIQGDIIEQLPVDSIKEPIEELPEEYPEEYYELESEEFEE